MRTKLFIFTNRLANPYSSMFVFSIYLWIYESIGRVV